MKKILLLKSLLYIIIAVALLQDTFAILNINTGGIVESEPSYATIILNSSPFNGTIKLSLTNLNSSIAIINFKDVDFASEIFNYTFLVTGIEPKGYSIHASVQNSSNVFVESLNKSGIVNSSEPIVIFISPTGTIGKESVNLLIRTNEVAVCKYDSSNLSFDNMTAQFKNTNSINHNQTLSGLVQGDYIYYIKCQDVKGYAMRSPVKLMFNVDLPPSAEIILSDPSPVKAGIIEVQVLASENLDSAPSLEYMLSDSAAKKSISLSGSGSLWKGYIIISESENKKIGTFLFSATDSSGNTGTKILGNLFVIDTEKPPTPQSVKAFSEPDGRIKISWYYDGEETDYFNVYRAMSPNVDYVDFLAKSNGSRHFVDTSTIDKVTYYYRISAVDRAGNEGPLSEEVYATSLDKRKVQEQKKEEPPEEKDVPKLLPPDLVLKVNSYISRIDSLVIDLEDAASNIQKKGTIERETLKELRLLDKIDNSRQNSNEIREKLESLKEHYVEESELDSKLSQIDIQIKTIQKTTPKDISITEKTEFIQIPGKEDVLNAVEFALRAINPSEAEKSQYIKKNGKIKEMSKVSVSAKIANVKYIDNQQAEKTIVSKRISFDDGLPKNDVVVIEIIPKAIAEIPVEIEILNEKYEVVEPNEVLKLGFANFDKDGEDVKYIISKKIDINELHNSKTMPLLSFSEIQAEGQNFNPKLTGSAIFSLGKFGLTKGQSVFVWAGIAAIALLGFYYIFFVKDYKSRLMQKAKYFKQNSKPDGGFGTGKNFDTQKHEISSSNAVLVNANLEQYVTSIKSDMAEKLLPLFMALDSHLKSKNIVNNGEREIAVLQLLIDQAHHHIDKDAYGQAVRLYPTINLLYQNLPSLSKGKVFSRCNQLHQRINSLKPIL